jgi:hypothetical protein
MMFEFKIDCTLGGWQRDAFYLFLSGNLVNLGDILVGDSVREAAISGLYAPDGQAIQEFLPELMTVSVPIQAVRLPE